MSEKKTITRKFMKEDYIMIRTGIWIAILSIILSYDLRYGNWSR